MLHHPATRAVLISLLFLGLYPLSAAQKPPRSLQAVTERKVNLYSEGTRLTGYVYTPPSVPPEQKLPAIIMGHGWGGVQASLRQDAREFAGEGYLVLTFDYRGWGESDSRVILKNAAPDVKKTEFTAEVRAIREVVDPLDMAADWQNAIHWVHGEPQVDPQRIGLWGSSMGGSLVVYAAAHDPRVKAVHSQVTGGLKGSLWTGAPATFEDATRRARGELGYPPPGAPFGTLRGAPVGSRFADYNPLEDITRTNTVAYQFVLSENERYLNNEEHAIAAYKRYTGPKNLVVLPGISHYDVYGKARTQVHALARAWFDKQMRAETP